LRRQLSGYRGISRTSAQRRELTFNPGGVARGGGSDAVFERFHSMVQEAFTARDGIITGLILRKVSVAFQIHITARATFCPKLPNTAARIERIASGGRAKERMKWNYQRRASDECKRIVELAGSSAVSNM